MIVFAILYFISKILLSLNSYILCCFSSLAEEHMDTVKSKLLRFLYSCMLISFGQNSLISIFCFLFSDNRFSAFKIFSVFSFAIQTVLLITLTALKSKRKTSHFRVFIKIFPMHKYISLFLSLFVVNICSISLFENRLLQENTSTLRTTLVIIIILSVIVISIIISGSFAKYIFLHQNSSFRKQYKIQLERFRKIEILNSELKSFRHDYSNHIHCIHTLLDSGEVLKAKEYIERLDSLKTINQDFFHTGNPICDAVLTNKQSYARSLGANIEANCHISSTIDSVDLCTLLSNAIDNSIEACVKCSGNKEIRVLAYVQHGFQYIKITNPSSISSLNLETTKKDKSLHGIGIANIKKIVKKYDGTFSAKRENKLFILKIILKIDKILPPPPTKFQILELFSKLT